MKKLLLFVLVILQTNLSIICSGPKPSINTKHVKVSRAKQPGRSGVQVNIVNIKDKQFRKVRRKVGSLPKKTGHQAKRLGKKLKFW